MTIYGPWVQDPDFEATLGGAWTGAGFVNFTTGVSITDPGATAANGTLVNQAISESASSGWGGFPPIVGGSGGLVLLDFDRQVSPTQVVYKAGRELATSVFTANFQFANNTPDPTVPGDAIGYEWETDSRATVLGAVLTVPITHHNIDTTASPDAPVGGSWSTRYVAASPGTWGSTDNLNDTLETWDGQVDSDGPTLLTIAPAAHLSTEEHQVDVGTHLSGGPHDGFLVVTSHVDVATVTLANYSADGEGVAFGANMTGPTITYLLQPARYRFLYEGTATPKRRIAHNRGVQRGSDGQGVTGGKRGLQRTSRQSSLRGGSFY